MKNNILWKIFPSILLLISCGILARYDGYYSYHKEKARRFTDNKIESVNRNVFISDLKFHVDIPVVRSVYIERGFRWGKSNKVTNVLNKSDTFFSRNEPDMPYQIVVEYLHDYQGDSVRVSAIATHIADTVLHDTLRITVFTYFQNKLDFKNTGKYELKIWQ
jgi:hypothetical protein